MLADVESYYELNLFVCMSALISILFLCGATSQKWRIKWTWFV